MNDRTRKNWTTDPAHLALVARLARLLDRAAELERQENEDSTG